MSIEKIKKLRIEKGLTQNELAEYMHMSQNAYSLLESGKTKLDIDRIIQIAEIFKISIAGLLTDISDESNTADIKAENMYTDYVISVTSENKILIEMIKEELGNKNKQITSLLSQNELLIHLHKSNIKS